MTTRFFPRRAALLALGQFGLALTAAACAPSVAPNTPATGIQPTARSGASGANLQATPVSGAAPLPVPPPTPGGGPPTVVGLASTPTPQASAAGSSSPEAAVTVMMTTDHRFDPVEVIISRGQTVAWRNSSRNPQTVTCYPSLVTDPSHVSLPSGGQPFDSGVVNTNTTFSHTFDAPGNYQYTSLPFESQNMFGTVSVQD